MKRPGTSFINRDLIAPLTALGLVITIFSIAAPNFFTRTTFASIAFQLPEFGILTLAMLLPIVTGGLNLAITFTANIAGLLLAWTLLRFGGTEAGPGIFAAGTALALGAGGFIGFLMGGIIAHTRAHPILVSLSMMMLLRGTGEFLTRGHDLSGFPEFIAFLGHGTILGLPVPFLVFLACVGVWHLVLEHTQTGFSARMLGSNLEATHYAGIPVQRVLIRIYVLSGIMSAVAGVIMLTRFNSVRIGHGDSYLLITILACFLGGVNPFGGFGRVIPVFVSLISLQLLSSGLNLINVNQHLATALWGMVLIAAMLFRWGTEHIKLLKSRHTPKEKMEKR